MNDLALAYVTCDKYSHIWEDWYKGFLKNWNIYDIPMYFLGEEKKCYFVGFKSIPHKTVTAEHWTSKLKTQIEQIPENNIFIWLDDHMQQFPIDNEFKELYGIYSLLDADALRIMGRDSKAHYSELDYHVSGKPIYQLKPRSPYLISFSPNIYRKAFLLEILDRDESPWDIEILGSGRVSKHRRIYAYHIDGWYINTIVQ